MTDYPRWWVMKSCRHWDAARNRRFRLVRLDGPTDHGGTYPAHGFDGDTGEIFWKPTASRGTNYRALLATARPLAIYSTYRECSAERRRRPPLDGAFVTRLRKPSHKENAT